MKVESILLALCAKFLEVGFKDRYVPYYPPIVEPGHTYTLQNTTCQCNCICAVSGASFHWGHALFTLAVSLATFAVGWWWARRLPPTYHGSPRRKGGGVITLPTWG